ncbi:MAG: PAC2 family protein, partial [Candidatus Marsarchaeota archaeon]|nr:PAC2 family protein [Candidatus Marsarchaeota archaeon]
VMLKSGGIRLVGNRFYKLNGKGLKRDIVLLTGEYQALTPEGQYEVNDKIVKFFKEKLKGSFIYTLGGYNIAKTLTGEPKVYANVTRKKIIPNYKDYPILFGKSKGMILGSAGMLLAFAKMQKMDGMCLMGETNLPNMMDASAAKAGGVTFF